MTYDIPLDQWDDYDPSDYDSARCNRCGATDLHWRNMGLNGVDRWVLFTDKLREHVCKPKPVTFDAEPEPCWLCGSTRHAECDGSGWIYQAHHESDVVWRQREDMNQSDACEGVEYVPSLQRFNELIAQGYNRGEDVE